MRTCRYVKVKFNWLWQTFPMEHNYCAMAEKKTEFSVLSRACKVWNNSQIVFTDQLSFFFLSVITDACMFNVCKFQEILYNNKNLKMWRSLKSKQHLTFGLVKIGTTEKLSVRITINKHFRSGIQLACV